MKRYAAGLGLALCLAPPALAAPTPTPGAALDPAGDTLGITSPQPDVVAFGGLSDVEALTLRLEFTNTTGELAGLIELDTDQDPTTGAVSMNSALCAEPVVLGVDYTIDLFNASPGQAPVRDNAFNMVGQAQLSTEVDALILTVPLDVIADDGIVHASTIIGTPAGFSDCVPNGAFMLTAKQAFEHALPIPALSWWGLLALCLVVPFTAWLGRRRSEAFGD